MMMATYLTDGRYQDQVNCRYESYTVVMTDLR